MSFDWASLVLFSGIINAIFCIAILSINRKTYRPRYVLWISIILVCSGLILFERIIRFSGLEFIYPEVLFVTSPLFFFILPLLLMFQKEIIGLSRYWYIHFILPFFAAFLLWPTIVMDQQDKLEMYHTEGLHDPPWIIILFVLYALFYSLKIFSINKTVRIQLFDEHANNEVELRLLSNRLVLLASVLTIAIPISLAIQYLDYGTDILDKLLFIIFSLIPHLFLFSVLTFKEISIPVEEEKKEKHKSFYTSDIDTQKRELIDFMEEKKPFLDKELKLQDLANLMDWNRSNLSYIINKGFNKNFYDFVNEYRLNFAIAKIENGEHKSYSLDYIAGISGFKNYVSFYRIFKRNKQESPKTYIEKLEKH